MTLNIVNYLSNMDENSKLLLIVIAVISVLLILIFIFNHLSNKKENYQSKIQKANKRKLYAEIEAESKNIEIPKKEIVRKPVIEEKIHPIENIIEEHIEEQEEIIEVLQDENESDVDRILREIKAASKEDNINLTQFEKEQEETAIISYDELCKRAGVQKKIYKAPSKSNDIAEIKEEKIVNEEKPKYKPSKIVSPIFGIQEEKKSFMSIDNSVDEMDLDQTFLTSLKEFRNGLE